MNMRKRRGSGLYVRVYAKLHSKFGLWVTPPYAVAD